MKKKCLSLFLCLCLFASLLSVSAFAAATNISVESATYYDSGDVESMTIDFGWNTASASSRLTVMTKKLRSAGEAGTNSTYGDFTDLGYYGKSFSSWNQVLEKSSAFGMLYYTEEQSIHSSKTNTITLNFDEGDIPLNVNKTYYLYLWTYYNGHYYPDNLFAVLRVKDGSLQYAVATGRNSYGSFSTLWEAVTIPDFVDVSDSAYYAAPVDWAVANGITNGTTATTFSPSNTCTKAQILTFLWRAAGSPEPDLSTPGYSYFADVAPDAYYYKAILWAAENGVIFQDNVNFGPNEPCTRATAVEYIWRCAGSPVVEAVAFTDVPGGTDTANAVSWAARYGVTGGTTATTFSPNTTCTRAQIVTFLHRYFVAPLKITI